jgi:DNA repair exonuclease SbcCD ATPase subunit
MKKKNQTATITSLMLIIIAIGSISAVIAQPSSEIRAERMVTIADNAAQTVNELIQTVQTDPTASEKIAEVKELADKFATALADYDLGVEYVDKANVALEAQAYEEATENATQALTTLRQVYITIRGILVEADVQITPVVDTEAIQEAIQRTTQRIQTLQNLISETAPIYQNLLDAQELLTSAQEKLVDNLDEAKENLRNANTLVAQVIQELKQVAKELTPSRIEGYCKIAEQYQYRYRERFHKPKVKALMLKDFSKD